VTIGIPTPKLERRTLSREFSDCQFDARTRKDAQFRILGDAIIPVPLEERSSWMVVAVQGLVTLLVIGVLPLTEGVASADSDPSADESQAIRGDDLLERAWQARADGRPDDAEADLHEALAQFEQLGDLRGERIARVNLAELLADQERVDEAVGVLRPAVELADNSVDRSAPIATRALLSDIYVDAGRPLEGLAWADATLVAAAALDHPEYLPAAVFTYLRTSAAVDGSSATLLAAVDHVERRLAGETGYDGPVSIPHLVFTHGAIALARGDQPTALDAMDMAVTAADTIGVPDDLPALLCGLGLVAHQAGEGARAREALERGLAIEPDVPLLATLALLEWREGWVDRAISRYGEAIDLAQPRGVDGETAELRIAQADAYAATGALDAARRQHEVALDELLRAGDSRGEVIQRARLARLDLRLGRMAEARRQAERSLSLNRDPFEARGVAPSYLAPGAAAEALSVLAAVYWERGEVQDAEAALVQASAVLGTPDAPPYAVAAAFGRVALLRGEPERAVTRFGEREAAAADWRLLHGLAVANWRMGDLELAEEMLRETLAAAVAEPVARSGEWDSLVPSLRAARGDLVSLLLQQQRLRDALDVVLAEHGRSVTEVQSQVGPAGAALVLGASSGEGVLWVVTAEDVVSHALGVSIVEIERRVLEYVAVVATEPVAGKLPAGAWREPSRALYELLRPVLEELAGVDELLVAPHGAFARLPFATLLDGDEPLVARYRIAMLGASSPEAERTLPRRPNVSASIARPEEAQSDADALGAVYRRATVIQTPPPSELIGQLGASDLCHLSVAVEPNPLQPERTIIQTSQQPGGQLTVGDLARVEVAAPLVVVTGVQAEPPLGQGVDLASIRPSPAAPAVADALLRGGASRVAICQWPATSAARAELLREFYRGVGRLGPVGSLQRAQARMAGSDVHPHYWGGWTVHVGGGESAL